MWSYSTNFMGPASLSWYENNNISYEEKTFFSKLLDKEITVKRYNPEYAGGRIDCRCDNPEDEHYDHYGAELHLPIMKVESFNLLSDWLMNYTSERLDINVLKTFEKETGHKLALFKGETYL